ncbi:MAG: hypothetical protein L0G22_06870 [Propionibacteriaceae bacterium]|nr:hypothetical protein [Propionibacteriaceae bacterium]
MEMAFVLLGALATGASTGALYAYAWWPRPHVVSIAATSVLLTALVVLAFPLGAPYPWVGLLFFGATAGVHYPLARRIKEAEPEVGSRLG